jgi:hypothetical protein
VPGHTGPAGRGRSHRNGKAAGPQLSWAGCPPARRHAALQRALAPRGGSPPGRTRRRRACAGRLAGSSGPSTECEAAPSATTDWRRPDRHAVVDVEVVSCAQAIASAAVFAVSMTVHEFGRHRSCALIVTEVSRRSAGRHCARRTSSFGLPASSRVPCPGPDRPPRLGRRGCTVPGMPLGRPGPCPTCRRLPVSRGRTRSSWRCGPCLERLASTSSPTNTASTSASCCGSSQLFGLVRREFPPRARAAGDRPMHAAFAHGGGCLHCGLPQLSTATSRHSRDAAGRKS